MTDEHDCAAVDVLWTAVRQGGRPGLVLLFGAPLKSWPEDAGQRLSEGAVACLRKNPAFSEVGVVLRPFLQYAREGKTGYGWLNVDVYYYGA